MRRTEYIKPHTGSVMMKRWVFRSVMVLFPLVGGAGCSQSPQEEREALGSLVEVEGTVTSIEDQVPVDGGVTIRIRNEDDREVILLFGSLFTMPPPGEERTALYEVIRQVKPGDRVQAGGVRKEVGIEITALEVLRPATR